MMWWQLLAAWVALSIPASLLVGRLLSRTAHCTSNPLEDLLLPADDDRLAIRPVAIAVTAFNEHDGGSHGPDPAQARALQTLRG